ncbi:MAG: cytochrome c1 [Pseudomonadota bacterium]
MKKLFLTLLLLPSAVFAAGGGSYFPADPANIDLKNPVSLQRGVGLYMNYCFGCHSMEYQRYERVANDLHIPLDIAKENFLPPSAKIGDLMTISMDSKDAATWFGAQPPDLTLVARVRGEDWLYNYLRAFYIDEKRPYGVNNTVFKDVGMPHVLAPLQGLQELTDDESDPLKLAVKGQLSPKEYDEAIRDLVNFLAYSGEPIRVKRESLGLKVLLFILGFFALAYFLKKEYWKDVH